MSVVLHSKEPRVLFLHQLSLLSLYKVYMTKLCLRLDHEHIVDVQFLCCYRLEMVQWFLFFVKEINIVCVFHF